MNTRNGIKARFGMMDAIVAMAPRPVRREKKGVGVGYRESGGGWMRRERGGEDRAVE
jgi:hypothetical protein